MMILYALAGAGIMASALFMVLSRNLVRMLLGLSLLATGTNLLLFLAGRVRSEQPPIIAEGAKTLGEAADPLSQALILTAIVIGFALTVVLAILVLRTWRTASTVDARNVDAAETLGPPKSRDPIDV
ncbi:NADH-quinone oxidoreductase subunit K [Sphingomonas sp. HF-S4]|uniref:NADH-quinone oxidoreductase subunit K n=1 Tax=Sphingomonas agrestis TaxID=3080540 RepID=A0ABU3Y323_9SPHN|nr:NADH-quinone oxidoreductase subunit K [Sphingomonas sp. HF-S4]MDV3455779.1 NADH-quinone oxidoreductase subunit K [Sphingomonas sp. HF-S4]